MDGILDVTGGVGRPSTVFHEGVGVAGGEVDGVAEAMEKEIRPCLQSRTVSVIGLGGEGAEDPG